MAFSIASQPHLSRSARVSLVDQRTYGLENDVKIFKN